MGQVVPEDRNHRGVELALVVGPRNKEPGAQAGNPGTSVQKEQGSWLEIGSCKKQDYQ